MKTITSRTNPLYRQWLSEIKHAGRPGHPIWLEGVHLCQAWLAHGGQPQWALIAEEARESADIKALVDQIEPRAQVWLPKQLLGGLCSLVTPPSVMFVAHRPLSPQASRSADQMPEGSYLLFDDVQDPGNVGTLLRTAAAAGIKAVYASAGTAACWSPKVLRAGQGAQFALQIFEGIDLVAFLERLHSKSDRPMVLATALDATAKPLYSLDLTGNVAWIVGHEGRGVAAELLAGADHRVFIPHDSDAIESLNVASAAAICLFEQRRQQLKLS